MGWGWVGVGCWWVGGDPSIRVRVKVRVRLRVKAEEQIDNTRD